MGILEGKKVLIAGVLTEASIAFSAAKIAQEQGATVVLSNFGRALSLCQRIAKRLPQEAPVIELDVTNTEHLSTLADRLREHVDSLDGVVHSIGFAPQEAMGDGFPEVAWEHAATAFQVSSWSLASLTQACRPLFGETASVVGLLGSAGQTNYAASKAGLVGLARSIARELGSRNITANVVAPGFVETDMTAELPEKRQQEILGQVPLGRYASTDEIAGVVRFLASDAAGYITGAVVPVDGGLGMGH